MLLTCRVCQYNNILTKQTVWTIIQELKKPNKLGSSEQWKLLNEFVVKQDQLRKIHIKNYIPHLAEFFNYSTLKI